MSKEPGHTKSPPRPSGSDDLGKSHQSGPSGEIFAPEMAQQWQVLSDRLVRVYPYHRLAFIALNILLTAINIAMGKPWWAVWPLLITGFVFMVHFLIYKAVTVDDAWVDGRAADLYDKSYDQGHINSIAGFHKLETVTDKRDAADRLAYEEEMKRRQDAARPSE